MKIIECPRDAIQGWKSPVSTALKVEYLNTLLQVGFDTLDFGSFVSPKRFLKWQILPRYIIS
jgi:hydroxymethylglutaryl-CoA lyase